MALQSDKPAKWLTSKVLLYRSNRHRLSDLNSYQALRRIFQIFKFSFVFGAPLKVFSEFLGEKQSADEEKRSGISKFGNLNWKIKFGNKRKHTNFVVQGFKFKIKPTRYIRFQWCKSDIVYRLKILRSQSATLMPKASCNKIRDDG